MGDHGVLEALETAEIAIFFSPSTDQLFRENLLLLIDGSEYLSLSLEGQASFPKLSFNNNEFILLPTVPLNCRSSKLCIIKNHGYENLEIRHEIIDDKAAGFIKIGYPNGRIIGGNGPNSLQIEISFISSISIAFTTRIDFLDCENNRFSIFVSGMTDNCILSNQPFLYSNDYCISTINNI